MAVPSGPYDVLASLDLSPVFGKIESTNHVEVAVPGADVLDLLLADLDSEDATVRRNAVIQLRYFREDGDRVAPALLGRLVDADANVRSISMSVLMAYPKQAESHVDAFLKILADGSDSERLMAIQLISRVAPASEDVVAAMEQALESAPENYKAVFESSLTRYRQRTMPK